MAKIHYNIPELLGTAFGIKHPVYFPYQLVNESTFYPKPKYTGIEVDLNEFEDSKQSWLGTPIIMPIRFLGGKGLKTLGADGQIVLVDLEPFDLPPATMVDFVREKITSEDTASSSNSSKKEIWGFTDWRVRMRGVCLTEPNVITAQEQKEMLLQYENIVQSIAVEGSLFEEKLVFNMLIKSIPFRQLQGDPYTLPFEIIAVSDDPEELVI